MKKYSTKKKSKLLFLDTHGYDFSRTDLILSMTGIIFLIATVCILHKLNAVYSGIIIISMLIALPVLISSYFMYKAEKKRFDEYCTTRHMEKSWMLCEKRKSSLMTSQK